MKTTIKILITAGAFCALFFFLGIQNTLSDQEENQCVSCHTSPRQLLNATREVAASGKKAPAASVESEGEG